MLLSENLNFGFTTIPTLLVIFIIGYVFWLFVLWYEARKDGFDDERFFDIVAVSTMFSALTYLGYARLHNYLAIYKPHSFLLTVNNDLFIVCVVLLSAYIPPLLFFKKRKWSIFRIYDIYSLAFGFLLVFISLGKYLVSGISNFLLLSVLNLIFYFVVLRFRGYKFVSGLIFSLFSFYTAALIFTLFRGPGDLLFCSTFVIIGVVNLYVRSQKNMITKNLHDDFINLIRGKLHKKEKDLQKEQNLLLREDPYSQAGRAEDNTDYVDETAIEDIPKEISDVRMGLIKSALVGVKRALAAIKIGRYGVCEVCGKPIDKARLVAYPEVTTCLEHADNN